MLGAIPAGESRRKWVTMRRIVLLLTVAVTMVAAMVPAGVVFAESLSDPSNNSNPSCFGAFSRSESGPPGPGTTFVQPVVTVAAPGGVDELAGFVGEINQSRPCPPPPTDL